jgi:CelD/BcsL family acetyltransferase involved in cellulose biosynthesis
MNISFLTLPKTFQEYKDGSKKSFKKNLRNILNRIRHEHPEHTLTLKVMEPSSKTDEAFESFYKGHIDYWNKKGSRSDFRRYPALRSFYKTIYRIYSLTSENEDKFIFSHLWIGKTHISSQFSLFHGNKMTGHLILNNPEYKRYNPGFLHIEKLIQYTLEEKKGKTFEFGRGNDSYKSVWTDSNYKLWEFTFYKNNFFYLLSKTNTFLKKCLPKLKIL